MIVRMNKDIVLRNSLRADDPAAIRSICTSTGFFRPDEIEVAVELAEETLQRGKESGYEFIFADKGDQVVAYLCYGLIPCSLISYDLYWIATEKSFQNSGLGKLLMHEMERKVKASGGRAIYAETSSIPLYESTRAFYERYGYILEHTMMDFYNTGDDKLVYVLRFQA